MTTEDLLPDGWEWIDGTPTPPNTARQRRAEQRWFRGRLPDGTSVLQGKVVPTVMAREARRRARQLNEARLRLAWEAERVELERGLLGFRVPDGVSSSPCLVTLDHRFQGMPARLEVLVAPRTAEEAEALASCLLQAAVWLRHHVDGCAVCREGAGDA